MKLKGIVLIALMSLGTVRSQEASEPTRSGFAPINGLEMYYEVHGEGKPLVLIHGSFMDIPMNWSGFIPLLVSGRKLILAEMQGHGRTKDIPREFGYAQMADDVAGLLDYLEIDRTDVLGYSMGGGVAFQMAVRHPESVRRLVVLSGTYAHDGWWQEVEALFSTMNGDMFRGSPLERLYLEHGNDPANFDAYIKKIISVDLKGYDWSGEVKRIKAPVLMALGDADGIRYEHALELFKALGGGKMGDVHGLPKSRLAILPGTTHVGMIQQTGLLVPMIVDFLEWDLDTAPPGF